MTFVRSKQLHYIYRMNTWEELSKIALLGTERAAPSPYLADQLHALGLDMDQDLSKIILEAATISHQMNKAGFPLLPYEASNEVPTLSTDIEVCSTQSAHHLQSILQKKQVGLLGEFVFYMKKAKKQIPPESLPDMLDRAVNDQAFWSQIQSIIGERGRWLISLNPVWQPLLEEVKITTIKKQSPTNTDWEVDLQKAFDKGIKSEVAQLATQLTNDQLNTAMAKGLTFLTARTLTGWLASNQNGRWNDLVSIAVINKVKAFISQGEIYDAGNIQFFKKILQNAAICVEPNTYDELRKDWETSANCWRLFEKPVSQFFQMILFRQKMKTALMK